MTRKITRIEQMEYDIGYASQCLDEVLAVASVLQKYSKHDTENPPSLYLIQKNIGALMSLIIEIQCNLEISLEKK
jgi:hypothetical protein